MSGETMQVRDNELRDMRWRSQQAKQRTLQAERDLAEARRRLRESTEELSRRADYDAQQFERALKEEERKILAGVEKANENLRIEMGRQNVLFRKQLDDIRRDIVNSNASIDAVNKRIREISDQLNESLRSITERLSQQKDRAQVYSNQLEVLLEKIDALNPDKLEPQRVMLLRDSIAFIKADMTNGDYQAVIGLAQSNIPVAATLLADLERKNDEYTRLRCDVSESIVTVRHRIQELVEGKDSQAIGYNGLEESEGEYTYNADIDFWSSGLFSLLCEKFDSEQQAINEEFLPQMDLENLNVAVKSIPLYIQRFLRCNEFAHEEFAVACGVQNMAIKIHSALTEDETWELTDSGFENEDSRQSYTMNFADKVSNRVAIVVLPQRANRQQSNRNDLSYVVEAVDGTVAQDEGMCRVIRAAVLARLEERGIDIGICGVTKVKSGCSSEAMIKTSCMVGEQAKMERIQNVKRQLALSTTKT